MRFKTINLVLIINLVLLALLGSCSKDENDDNTDVDSENTGVFTDSRDSKIYKWVKIGDQTWMAENLNYTKSDGYLQHVTNKEKWKNTEYYDAWCYFNNDDNNGQVYGALYQFEAAKEACPDGWHLPTSNDWNILIKYLEINGYSCDGETNSPDPKYRETGKIAKSLATNYGWKEYEYKYSVGNSSYPEYQNKTRFSALPGGYFSVLGFYNFETTSAFWSSTMYSNNTSQMYGYYLHYNDADVGKYWYNKWEGLSVRCIKDN